MVTNTKPHTVISEGSITDRLQYLLETFQYGQEERQTLANFDSFVAIEDLKSVLDNILYQSFIDKNYIEYIISGLEEITYGGIVLSSKYRVYSIEELCQKCLRVSQTIRKLVHYNKIIIENEEDGNKEEYEFDYNILDNGGVILGRNGCGKTTLAKSIANVTGACLIKANRTFDIEEIIPIQKSVDELHSEKKANIFNEYFGQNRIHLFCEDNTTSKFMKILSELLIERRIKREDYIDRILKSADVKDTDIKTDIDLIIELWNCIFKNDNVQLYLTNNYELMLRKGTMQSKGYNIVEMSDGEKDVLYIIAMIVYAVNKENKSIIVVDEPEKHLHKTLLIDLWNKLEHVFSSCKFIYFSHNLNFIESRHLPKFWLKKLDHNTFDIEIVKLGDDIPQTLYPLFGLNKKIIFCEGKMDSYDYKIYSTLFPSWKVVCCGGCTEVVNNTKVYHTKWPNDQCIGIVDKDYRDANEIQALQQKGIYVLEVAEIENLFLQKDFIKKYAQSIGCESTQSIEEIKVRISIWLKKFLEQQAENYVCFKTNKLLNQSIEEDEKTDKFSSLKNKIDKLKAIDLSEEKEAFKNHLSTLTNNIRVVNLNKPTPNEIKSCNVSDDNYAEIIKYFNEKSSLIAVEQALGITRYAEKALNVLRRDVEYRDLLVKGLPIELQQIYQEEKKLKK